MPNLEVRRVFSYGSNPWAVVRADTGQAVWLPGHRDLPDLYRGDRALEQHGRAVMNPMYFPRKRDARAFLDAWREEHAAA